MGAKRDGLTKSLTIHQSSTVDQFNSNLNSTLILNDACSDIGSGLGSLENLDMALNAGGFVLNGLGSGSGTGSNGAGSNGGANSSNEFFKQQSSFDLDLIETVHLKLMPVSDFNGNSNDGSANVQSINPNLPDSNITKSNSDHLNLMHSSSISSFDSDFY